jgi:hypothetical protein
VNGGTQESYRWNMSHVGPTSISVSASEPDAIWEGMGL